MRSPFDAPPADRYDVVVAGSGAAALIAAAVAAERGLTVLVLEKSRLLGGNVVDLGGYGMGPVPPVPGGCGRDR